MKVLFLIPGAVHDVRGVGLITPCQSGWVQQSRVAQQGHHLPVERERLASDRLRVSDVTGDKLIEGEPMVRLLELLIQREGADDLGRRRSILLLCSKRLGIA